MTWLIAGLPEWFAAQLVGPMGVLLVICFQVALLASLAHLFNSRMADAAMRYRMWLTSVLLVLALLPMHLFLGGWPVSITRQARTLVPASLPNPVAITPSFTSSINNQDTLSSPPSPPLDVISEPIGPALTNNDTTNDGVRPVDASTKLFSGTAWITWGCLSVYLLMVCGLTLRTVLATRRLMRKAHTAQPASDSVLALARNIATSLKLARLTTIGLIEPGSMPLVIGFRQPTLLLPSDFAMWPVEGQRAVLAHELAHVARRDAWGQLLARSMCCLYWFHPGSWLIERRLAESRELATDARALTSGQTASEYAQALLNVLKRLNPSPMPSLALPIAAKTPLHHRIRFLLESSECNKTHSRWLSLGLISLLIIATSLSCVRLVTSTWTEAPLVAGPSPIEPTPTTAATPIAIQQTSQSRPSRDNDLVVRMRQCEVSTVAADKAGAKVTVTGQVVKQGQPVAGAIVVFRESSQNYLESPSDWEKYAYGGPDAQWISTPDVLARTTTAADGRFQFEKLTVTKRRDKRGKWTGDVVALHPDAGLAWLDLRTENNADLKRENVTLQLEGLTDIAGVVLNQRQEPVPNAEVSIPRMQLGPKILPNPAASAVLDTLFSQITVATHTNAEGKFTFKNLPQDMLIQLSVDHVDYLSSGATVATFDLAKLKLDSVPHDYFANAESSPCRIVMNEGTIVTGQVVDDQTRRPIADVSLNWPETGARWKTDASGNFKLHLPPLNPQAAVPERSFRVLPAQGSGYLAFDYRFNMQQVEDPLTVGLKRGVLIRGKVVANDGQPIEKAFVRVWNHQEYGGTEDAVTNEKGEYELLVPRGVLLLFVGGANHGYEMPTWQALHSYPQQVNTDDWPRALVNTESGQPQTIKNIIVPRAAPIQCLFTMADGKPVANASIVIKDHPRRPSQRNLTPTELATQAADPFGGMQSGNPTDISDTKLTDKDGRVTMLARKPTENAVVVAKLQINNQTFENQFHLKNSQDASGLVKIVIQPPAPLTGRILRNGQPVAGAIVRIRERKPEPYQGPEIQIVTNEDGMFLTNVTPKDYDVMLQSLPDFRVSWNGKRAVKVVNGAYAAGDLEINFPLEELAGQLLNQNGQPLDGAKILPVPLNPNAAFLPLSSSMATTGMNGNFRFPQLPRGEYDLRIKLASGEVIESINQKLTPKKNVTVKVMIGGK